MKLSKTENKNGESGAFSASSSSRCANLQIYIYTYLHLSRYLFIDVLKFAMKELYKRKQERKVGLLPRLPL